MRYLMVSALFGALVGLAACGATAGHGGPAPRAPQLVFFQRNGGLAATLDAVTIRTDGAAHYEKRYGGAGGRFDDFRLSAPMLTRVRAGLARVPARLRDAGRRGMTGGATYILRYRGRSYAVREGAVPRPLRPVVAALDDVLDGSGRSGRVRSIRQAPA